MRYTKEMIHSWHEEGVRVAGQWLRCEHRMVEILGYLHLSEGYYLYECQSLKEYALSMWHLPYGAARDLVTVAIKATLSLRFKTSETKCGNSDCPLQAEQID